MNRRRRNGVGSNQYVTRPGRIGSADGREGVAVAVEHFDDDLTLSDDLADIAAAFNPAYDEWTAAGVPGSEIEAWTAAGVVAPSPAVHARWAGLTPAMFGACARPAEITSWVSRGFHGQELVDWSQVPFPAAVASPPDEASRWREYGYTAAEAATAVSAGLWPADFGPRGRWSGPITDRRVKRVQKAVTRRWVTGGFFYRNPYRHGLDEEETVAFRMAGYRRPHQMDPEWVQVAQQVSWLLGGHDDRNDLLCRWMRCGTPEVMSRAADTNFGWTRGATVPELATRIWGNGDLSQQDAKDEWGTLFTSEWRGANAYEANQWMRYGFDAADAARWKSAGVLDPEQAGTFQRLGLNPDLVEPWRNAEHPDRVPSYLAAGISPTREPAS